MDDKFATEIFVRPFDCKQKQQIITHERVRLSVVAEFAKQFIQIASGTAMPDGETSTGYPQARMLTPQEVVDRGMAIARIAIAAFEKENMIALLPPGSVMMEGDDSKVGF